MRFRHAFYGFFALALCAVLFPRSTLAESPPYPPAPVHEAIAAAPAWLNMTRPLMREDMAGRIILLGFWSYGSVPGREVARDMQALQEEFGNTLLAVSVHCSRFAHEKETENLRQALMRLGVTHPVINDADHALLKQFALPAQPGLLLIDPRGKAEAVFVGTGHREELEQKITSLKNRFGKLARYAVPPLAGDKSARPDTPLLSPGKLEAIPDYHGEPALAVADSGHNRMLLIGRNGGILMTIGSGRAELKDGDAREAAFHNPQGLLYDEGKLYVADTGNHALRVIDLADGRVTTLAGTGEKANLRPAFNIAARACPLSSPYDIAFFPDKKHIVIAMAGLNQLWLYDVNAQNLSTISGNGWEGLADGMPPANALAQPDGLAVYGDTLYIVDAGSSALRVMEKSSRRLSTSIGDKAKDSGYVEGNIVKARMQHPMGVYADSSGIYIADTYNNAVRRYDAKTGLLFNYTQAEFNEPGDVTRLGDTLYVADTGNNRIATVDMRSGKTGTLGVK